MNKINKIVSSAMILITSSILCVDIFFGNDLKSFFSHVVHCCAEGGIILMFSRELRGEFYR